MAGAEDRGSLKIPTTCAKFSYRAPLFRISDFLLRI